MKTIPNPCFALLLSTCLACGDDGVTEAETTTGTGGESSTSATGGSTTQDSTTSSGATAGTTTISGETDASSSGSTGTLPATSEGSSTGEDTIDPGEAVATYSASYCATVRSCCAEAGFETSLLAECEAGVIERQSLGLVETGAIRVDGEQLEACLQTLEDLGATCTGSPFAVCDAVWQGTLQTGEACTTGAECSDAAGPVTCSFPVDGEAGTCQPLSRGVVGSPCVDDCYEGRDCSFSRTSASVDPAFLCYVEDGLFCDRANGSVCATIVPTGDPCELDEECGVDGYCERSGAEPVCAVRRGLDEPCVSGSECSLRDASSCDGTQCVEPPFAFRNRCEGIVF